MKTRACLAYLMVGVVGLAAALPFLSEGGQMGPGEGPRENNPVFNVWEYAYTHDGSVNTRSAQPETTNTEDSNNNPCLWAIVSCCGARSGSGRDECFETLGCPGAWFENLCSQDFQSAAHAEVSNILQFG
ncbi:uncharacterized protein LOC122249935 [Penaeus japonicus]|uniref:uncharacterized protein LOC122249935 n=1 Tax=Penaeus japonicus TaxID=27405 RepID=UPI001C70FD16|nr:uncharacterized protein LOC122249935 [Penaeus japonicus]